MTRSDTKTTQGASQAQQNGFPIQDIFELQMTQVSTFFEGLCKVQSVQSAQTHQAIDSWTHMMKTSVDESAEIAQMWRENPLNLTRKSAQLMGNTDWIEAWMPKA